MRSTALARAAWKDCFMWHLYATLLFIQPTIIVFFFFSRVTMLTQVQSVNLGNLQILFHRADAQQTFCIRCLYSSLSPLSSVHFSLFSLNYIQIFSAHFTHLSSRFKILILCLKMIAVPLCLIFAHWRSAITPGGVILLNHKPFKKLCVQEL